MLVLNALLWERAEQSVCLGRQKHFQFLGSRESESLLFIAASLSRKMLKLLTQKQVVLCLYRECVSTCFVPSVKGEGNLRALPAAGELGC